MSRCFALTTLVVVHDESAMLAVANAHARARFGDGHPVIEDVDEGLKMLIDIGSGGEAYPGDLLSAGIENLCCDCVAQSGFDLASDDLVFA